MRWQIAEYVILLYKDIPVAVYEVLLAVLCLGVIVFFVCYGLKRGLRWIAGLLLLGFIFLIYCSTVICRTTMAERSFDFHPFWSYKAIEAGRVELLAENIMNVVVFVPVGLLLSCVLRRLKWWIVLIIGIGISVSIEALQYFFHKGFSEVDDVFHNTLGCAIGIMSVAIIKGIWLLQ